MWIFFIIFALIFASRDDKRTEFERKNKEKRQKICIFEKIYLYLHRFLKTTV